MPEKKKENEKKIKKKKLIGYENVEGGGLFAIIACGPFYCDRIL